MGILQALLVFLRGLLKSQADLAAENMALRQQLTVFQRSTKRPRLRIRDRVFWTWLSWLWNNWRWALILVKPETVISWRRQGFRLYWRWKSRKKPGRPKVDAEIRRLIRCMSRENPTHRNYSSSPGPAPQWGRPRVPDHVLGHCRFCDNIIQQKQFREDSRSSPQRGARPARGINLAASLQAAHAPTSLVVACPGVACLP